MENYRINAEKVKVVMSTTKQADRLALQNLIDAYEFKGVA